MPLRLSQYMAPVAEPLSLTAAKLHLRLATDIAGAESYTTEDTELAAMIAAAREVAEVETWKAIVFQIWDLYLDEWPLDGEIRLPKPPLRSVDFIRYTTTDGIVNTFASTEYDVDTDSTPGRIVLGYEKTWPSESLAPKNPIHIRFRCGHIVPFSANSTTDIITAIAHPFSLGDRVRLSVSGGVMPGGLAVKTDYYVVNSSTDWIQLSTTSGGSPINITSNGSGNLFIGEVPPGTIIGMLLVLTDMHEERGDTVIGKFAGEGPAMLPRGAAHYFAMDSARTF